MSRLFRKLKQLFKILKYKIKYRNLKLGKNVKIFGEIKIIDNSEIIIGDFCTINEGVLLNARDKIIIGKYCRISPYVQIHTGQLDLSKHYKNRPHQKKPVIIEDGVWLAAGAIILPGVKIGKGSVVAAGSVVNKNIPPYELWGGVPAKKLKSLKQ